MLGERALITAREAKIIFVKVIKASTMPPTSGMGLRMLKRLIKIAKPELPNKTEGTAHGC